MGRTIVGGRGSLSAEPSTGKVGQRQRRERALHVEEGGMWEGGRYIVWFLFCDCEQRRVIGVWELFRLGSI
jgi:hypothetical protein